MNICINNFVGLPAAGKTTFSHRLKHYIAALQQQETKDEDTTTKYHQQMINVITICYDDFIKIDHQNDYGDDDYYLKNQLYKKQRFQLLNVIKQLICDIKENDLEFIKTKEILHEDFPFILITADGLNSSYSESTLGSLTCISSAASSSSLLPPIIDHQPKLFQLQSKSENALYLIVIDDNSYYKSMRKQLKNLAKYYQIGYYITYFRINLEQSIKWNDIRRSENKQNTISNEFIMKMYKKFEEPLKLSSKDISSSSSTINDSKNDFIFIIDNWIEMETSDQITKTFDAILKQTLIEMKNPKIYNNPLDNSHHNSNDNNSKNFQSILHKIDLQLRREISIKMKDLNESSANVVANDVKNKKMYAKYLNEKRKFLLQQLRCNLQDNNDGDDDDDDDEMLPNDLNQLKLYL